MNKSECFENLPQPPAITIVPNEGNEGSEMPLYDVQFFDFADELIGLPDARLRGIAPWDAWWERLQLERRSGKMDS